MASSLKVWYDSRITTSFDILSNRAPSRLEFCRYGLLAKLIICLRSSICSPILKSSSQPKLSSPSNCPIVLNTSRSRFCSSLLISFLNIEKERFPYAIQRLPFQLKRSIGAEKGAYSNVLRSFSIQRCVTSGKPSS